MGWTPDPTRLEQLVGHYPAFVVRTDGGELAGYAYTAGIAPDVLQLANLLLVAGLQGQGVGTRLVQKVEAAAVDQGFRTMILVNSMLLRTVHPKRPATTFYERLGYHCVLDTGPTKIFAKRLAADSPRSGPL